MKRWPLIALPTSRWYAFLSGGLDSSAVVAEMAAASDGFKTFSIGFEEQSYSSSPMRDKRPSAMELNTSSKSSQRTRLQLWMILSRATMNRSQIPWQSPRWPSRGWHESTSRLSFRATEAMKRSEATPATPMIYGKTPCAAGFPVLASAASSDARCASGRRRSGCHAVLRGKSTLTNLSLNPPAAYANTLSLCRQPHPRRRLLHRDVTAAINGHRPEQRVMSAYGLGDDALRRMTATDVEMLLPDDFLTKVDCASMACALEVRPPLVDHEFLELTSLFPGVEKCAVMKRSGSSKNSASTACRVT